MSSPNWVPSPSPGHFTGRTPEHLLDGAMRPARGERATKYTTGGSDTKGWTGL